MKGSTVPISYNILQGSLAGILADPPRHSLDIAINPSPNGGALEIQLPRHVIDCRMLSIACISTSGITCRILGRISRCCV